ncbi:MAG: isoaspartyl peptidase/L-asparaginase [Veillonellales bacterium]
MKKTVLLIHGGAGSTINSLSLDELEERRTVLLQALKAGQDILQNEGSSIDATTAAVVVMENSPLFNAGKGAVFTHEGKNEMDACIMDGKTLNSGAVGGVRRIKNPIKAANVVMSHSTHVLLISEGAEKFAKEYGVECVEPEYFYTDFRYHQLQEALKKDAVYVDHDIPLSSGKNKQPKYMGTVGAVALDCHGNLAAATSTGGLTNKRYGRVGDSAIAGAGNYANNNSIAMSGTGTGDIFVQAVAGHEVNALYQYKGLDLKSAVSATLQKIYDLGGHGGMIALDKDGNYVFEMNTDGMYRGVAINNEEPIIKCFKDEA